MSIARESPEEIYSNFDFFEKLLDNENQILKWTAIDIIGYLAKIDEKSKIDKIMDKLYGFLSSGKLITANHAIFSLSLIAISKPEYREKITEEFLKVERNNYETIECRNIAIGKVILALDSYICDIRDKKPIVKFLKNQTNNTRNATKKKAEKLLKKINTL